MKLSSLTVLIIYLLFSGCHYFEGDGESSEPDTLRESEPPDIETFPAQLYWKQYQNNRFDFCFNYPSKVFEKSQASSNADGQTFLAPAYDAKMTVFARMNVLDESDTELYKDELNSLKEGGKTVSEHQPVENGFEIWGKEKNKRFYHKTIIKNGQIHSFYIWYPTRLEKEFSEIIKNTTKLFPECI